MNMNGYGKFVLALVQVLITLLITVTDPLQEGGASITPGEFVWLATGVLNAILVIFVPNLDAGVAKYAKIVIHGSLAVLAIVLNLAIDGLSANDWLLLASAFLTGGGILVAKAPQHQNRYALAA